MILICNNQELIYYIYNHRYLEAVIILNNMGLFEVAARFISFKTVLKKYFNNVDPINYKIGRAGIGALYIVGVNYVLLTIWIETDFQFPFSSYVVIVLEMNVDGLPCSLLERFLAIFLHIAISIFAFIASIDKRKYEFTLFALLSTRLEMYLLIYLWLIQ